MDTEILFRIATKLIQFIDSSKLIQNLNALITAYDGLAAQRGSQTYSDQAHQYGVNLLDGIERHEASLRFTPIETVLVDAVGLNDLHYGNLHEEIHSIIFRGDSAAPAVVRTELETLRNRIQGYHQSLEQIWRGLDSLHLSVSATPLGNEVSVFLPSSFLAESSSSFADELYEFQFALNTISEFTSGDHTPVDLQKVNSGSLLATALVARAALGLFMKVVDWCLEKRHRILENKLLFEQVRAAGLTNDLQARINKELEEKSVAADEELLKNVVSKRAAATLDEPRKNELLSAAMPKVTRYVSRRLEGGGAFAFSLKRDVEVQGDEGLSELDASANEYEKMQASILDRIKQVSTAQALLENRDAPRITKQADVHG